jgi:hypothetical protein
MDRTGTTVALMSLAHARKNAFFGDIFLLWAQHDGVYQDGQVVGIGTHDSYQPILSGFEGLVVDPARIHLTEIRTRCLVQ